MKTITVKANNQVGTVTEHTVVTQTNTPTVIKATDKTNYEIFDTVEGRAPKDIITKRVDKDLHVSFENDIQNTDLIIEGFYDNIDSALIGVADDGSYYYYVPDTGEMTDYVTELQMGEVQSQSLGGNSYATPWWIGATEAEGLSALPWLFGLAGVGIAAGSLGGSDSSSNSPVDTMAPDAPTSINVGNGDAFITADEITDGQVSVVVGLPSNAVSGDVVIVNGTEQNLSEDDILNGNVIVQVNAPAEGELFNVSATLRDEAGNESDALDTTVGVVDTIAPDTPAAAPEISDNVANDGSGDVLDPAEIIGADGLTNDSTPSVVVPADQLANGTPQLVIDGVVVASIAETNTDGSVSLTPTDPLLDGEYDVSYNIKDAAGNVSGNAPVVTVIVDTTTSITIIEPIAGDNVINGDEAAEGFNVRGTGTAGDTVTLTNGLGTVIGSGVVSDNGQWIINVNSVQINAMGEGAESLTATAKDAAGNAAVATADITVVSATTVSISSPIAGDNVINADEAAEGFDVRGTGTAGDTITLFSESGNIIGTAIVDANNKWIIPVDEDDVDEMGQGAETLTVQAEDAVGNISTETASITVGVDTIAPGGGTDATQVAPVVAIAEAADGVNATEFQNGVQTQVTLPTGTIAGDIVTLTVTPDGGAPITVDYVVTAEDLSGDGIAEVTIPNNTIGGITADGDYSVTAVVTDAAGNSSAASDAVGFIVDTIAPDTPAAAPEISDNVANDGSGDVLDPAEIIGTDGLTNDSTPSVVVPADQLANGTPQLVIDGVVVASIAETNTDGSVSLTPIDPLLDGEYDVSYNIKDAAGNVSGNAPVVTVTVDTIAPGGGTDATQVAPVVAIAEAADGVNATEFQNGVQTQVTLPTGTIAGDIVTLTVTPDGGAPITVDYVVTAEDLSGDGIAEVTIPNNTIGGITADGDYSVTAVVTDAAGNSSAASNAVGFIVDTIAPDTPAAAPEISDNVANDGSGDVLDPAEIIGADGLTNDSTPSVVVPADQLANGTPQLVIDGVVVASVAETNTDGSVSLTPTDPLLDGEYDVSYNIKDAAGNVSGNAPVVTVTVDTIAPGGGTDATQVAPVVAIAEAADGVNATEFQNGVQTQVTLPTGTIAGDIVTLTVTPDGGAPITVDYVVTAEDLSGDGIAEVTIPNNTIGGITADGDYSVTAVVTDAAGNSSAVSDAVGFTVDVTIIAQDDTANLDLALQVTTLVAISEEESTILEALETNNGTESNLSFTVNDNTSGTVNIELTESALVQVADAISLEVYNSDNELVYIAANVNNPLVGNVAGLEVLGLTNNNGSLTATLSGLEPGNYKIVVSKDSSTLETLINDLTVSELGEAGVVLGTDNQDAILDAVETGLGFPLGSTVRATLEMALNLTTDLGVGEFLSIAQPILIAAGAPIDPLLDAVAAEVLSNTLALLETTEVTATLTEYSFDNNTVVSGNVIDPDLNSIGEIGEDIVTANTVLTNIIGANGIATSTQLDGVNAFSINGEYGVLIIDEYGKYEYRANGDYASSGQSDVFTYTIFDDVTGASDTAELVIDLTYTIDMAAGDDIVNITDNVLQSSLDGLDDNANTINIDSSLSVNIIGGEGFDTINLTGAGQTLSLSDIFQTEVVDISGTGANTLTLQAADITNSGTSDPIYVKGDSDDTVDLGGVGADLSDTDGANSPSVWVDAGTDVTDTNGQVYNVWQLDNNAATQVYIDTDITVI